MGRKADANAKEKYGNRLGDERTKTEYFVYGIQRFTLRSLCTSIYFYFTDKSSSSWPTPLGLFPKDLLKRVARTMLYVPHGSFIVLASQRIPGTTVFIPIIIIFIDTCLFRVAFKNWISPPTSKQLCSIVPIALCSKDVF